MERNWEGYTGCPVHTLHSKWSREGKIQDLSKTHLAPLLPPVVPRCIHLTILKSVAHLPNEDNSCNWGG